MKNSNLLIILSFLIAADFTTTLVGVQYMGAIELNPLYKYCGNLEQWLTIKYLASVVCLTTLACIKDDRNKKVVTAGLTILTLLYVIVVLSNLLQIVINI